MKLIECESMALRVFLQTIADHPQARDIRWRGRISEGGAFAHRFFGRNSTFEITASDALQSHECAVPLIEDGVCVHTEESLRAAFLAAISETAMAMQALPVPTPLLPASGRLTA